MTASLRGRVFDVQRCCVHDGPGLRTTVFLAGCPLRCAWCHNPECFSGEGSAWRTPESVLEEVLRDRDFFVTSGGGLTVSGGEPLLQREFLGALLVLAKQAGLHTCVQTAGEVPREAFLSVLDQVDLFQFDLKHLDPARHQALTGAGNARILENLEWLLAQGRAVEVRRPLVPGFNDDARDLERLAAFLRAQGLAALTVLPYQRSYLAKYARLGLEARCATTTPPTRDHLAVVRELLGRHGVALHVESPGVTPSPA